MGIRELQRRATPRLLEHYLEMLPRIRDPRQFQIVFIRVRVTAAMLGVDISERLTSVAGGKMQHPLH